MAATEVYCVPTSTPMVKRAEAWELIRRARALIVGDPISEIGSGVTTLLDAAMGSIERAQPKAQP